MKEFDKSFTKLFVPWKGMVTNMKICPKCKRIYNKYNDYYCLNDHYPLEAYTDEQSKLKQLEIRKQQGIANIPKCPTCQSANIKKISITKRAMHGATFGLFSKTARSQFECNNCGYKW